MRSRSLRLSVPPFPTAKSPPAFAALSPLGFFANSLSPVDAAAAVTIQRRHNMVY
jgi:hypothetical protein